MTTPGVSYNLTNAGVRHVVQRNALGVVINTSDIVIPAGRSQRQRLASVSNPKRFDGTRRPASWVSSGGTFGQEFDPGVTIRRSDGVSWFLSQALYEAPGITSYTSPISELRATAIRSALGHYADAQAQLGVAMREASDTVKLVSQYYRGASDLLGKVTQEVVNDRNFKKSMKEFAHGWREAPSRYLEYLYGMRPLADDVSNAVTVLTGQKDAGRALSMTLRGKTRLRDEERVSLRTPQTGVIAEMAQSLTAECRASLNFILPSWYFEALPPVTAFSEAYEHASYSFVLDWALPIGTWLRGFEGLQLRPFFREGSTTYFGERAASTAVLRAAPGYTIDREATAIRYHSWYMNRQAFTSFPTETVMSLPRLRSVLKIGLLDQFAALAGQRFAKLGKAIG